MTTINASGQIRKMNTRVRDVVEYQLPIGDTLVEMNPLIGRQIRLEYLGEIRCIHCNRRTRKSYSQGYCFPCMNTLARCDRCMVSPEKCHYDAGTCREPTWAEGYCLQPHTVYLSNTGTPKVGITRGGNEEVRWADQGATEALAICDVPDRLSSGLVEAAFKAFINDRTNWRTMLSGEPDSVDLAELRDLLLQKTTLPVNDVVIPEEAQITLNYPVTRYPEKVRSLNIEKLGVIEGELWGIKGQYLIFDLGVINIRKYTGYHWQLDA